MFLLSLLPRQMQKMKAQWVWKYQQVREIIFSDDISICFGLSDQSMRNQDRALWQWGNRAELLQGSWEECCCSPVQATISWNSKNVTLNTDLAKYWQILASHLWSHLFCIFLKYGNVCTSSVGTINTRTPHIQCCDCLSSQAAHARHSPLCPLQDSALRQHKFGCITFFFFFFSAFTHSVIELHWSGTKQILSIQHQPLVSALTAHNGLWDQALIERVISHDFLVIAFNDLILNPSRRQRQLRALSIRDGAQCLTDWDLIWPGFLKVVV